MKNRKERLYEIAEGQQGYFTAKQAVDVGYVRRSHHYHVGTGSWIREHRGIYRLAQFPLSEEGQYVLWSLWSCDRRRAKPQGVFSHQTALSIHGLSDVMPEKLHMTVPKGFRRSAVIPKVLSLHYGDISSGDIELRQGYAVVCAMRAVIELLDEEILSQDLICQALKQAMQRGLVTRDQLNEHPEIRDVSV